MSHMTEEELIGYRDGETKERQRFASHLNGCEVCRREMERIEAVFAALDGIPVPDPGEDFARRVWQEISSRLPEKHAPWWHALLEPRRLAAVGAMAAIIVLAFLLGRFTKKNGPEEIADAGKVRERVLVVAVGDHLGRSEMVLMEFANTAPEKGQKLVNISAQQKRAEDLLEENRLYRQTAKREGDALMASTLDELEPILLDIANSPDEITPAQFEGIQKRIAAKGILLKVRVVHQDLRRRPGNTALPPAQRDVADSARNRT